VEIKNFGGGRLLELCVLSLIREFLPFCHIHHTKSGDTGCIWISSTLGSVFGPNASDISVGAVGFPQARAEKDVARLKRTVVSSGKASQSDD
jgi:hypothetical protein